MAKVKFERTKQSKSIEEIGENCKKTKPSTVSALQKFCRNTEKLQNGESLGTITYTLKDSGVTKISDSR